MNKIITAIDVHRILSIHSVKPTSEFTAAAGVDYGYVAAWLLKEQDGEANYLIQYSNNGQTDYEIADDADDLAAWLESTDLDALDTVVQTANIRGQAEIDAATAGNIGPFFVLRTRYWYGPTETSDIERMECRIDPIEFESYQDAQDWVVDAENGSYCLSHNESGASSYKIIAV